MKKGTAVYTERVALALCSKPHAKNLPPNWKYCAHCYQSFFAISDSAQACKCLLCNAQYCSTQCRQEGLLAGHTLECSFRSDTAALYAEFRRHARRTSELFECTLAALLKLFTTTLCSVFHSLDTPINIFDSSILLTDVTSQLDRPEVADAISRQWNHHIDVFFKCYPCGTSIKHDEIEESFSLLQSILWSHSLLRHSSLSFFTGAGGFALYQRLVSAVQANILHCEVSTSLHQLLTHLSSPTINITEKIELIQNNASTLSSFKEFQQLISLTNELHGSKNDVVLLSQFELEILLLSSGGPLFEQMQNQLALEILCLAPNLATRTTHSCCPNVQWEYNNGDVSLIALRDLRVEEVWRVSRINLDTHESRQLELKGHFGSDFVCSCDMCLHERGEQVASEFDQLHFAYQYMQQNNNSAALTILLQLQHTANTSLLGDVIHTIGAIYLDKNDWKSASEVWKSYSAEYGSHEGVNKEIVKLTAYPEIRVDSEVNNNESNIISVSTSSSVVGCSSISSGVYLTCEPILSVYDCELLIAAASSRAGGWSTSRHYAVPTTDIPVHEDDNLLLMFKEKIMPKLGCIIAKQFFDGQPCSVNIHDAFVVKYSAGAVLSCSVLYFTSTGDGSAPAQKLLPIHTDQSTHSFTIALNNVSEFTGGGTYFVPLRQSILPNIGYALSFNGNISHGGAPIVSGTRYILAVFIYAYSLAAQENNDISSVFNRNKRKWDDSNTAADTFSFGFSEET